MQTQTVVPSLMDAVAATMVKGEKKKPRANGCPIVDEPELRRHVDLQVEAKNLKKQAEAEEKFHGNAIADRVRAIMDRDGYAGRFAGTYEVVGDVHRVKCIFENKFSVKSADKGQLQALLGEGFGDLLEEKITIRLKPEVLENEVLGQELMRLVGQRFAEFFESESVLVAKSDAKEKIYRVVSQDKLELLRLYMRQNNPSIR